MSFSKLAVLICPKTMIYCDFNKFLHKLTLDFKVIKTNILSVFSPINWKQLVHNVLIAELNTFYCFNSNSYMPAFTFHVAMTYVHCDVMFYETIPCTVLHYFIVVMALLRFSLFGGKHVAKCEMPVTGDTFLIMRVFVKQFVFYVCRNKSLLSKKLYKPLLFTRQHNIVNVPMFRVYVLNISFFEETCTKPEVGIFLNNKFASGMISFGNVSYSPLGLLHVIHSFIQCKAT